MLCLPAGLNAELKDASNPKFQNLKIRICSDPFPNTGNALTTFTVSGTANNLTERFL